MPNHYATVDELREVAPDALRSASTQYNEIFYKLSRILSRWIDNHTRRTFYPETATKYYDGDGQTDLWIDDLFSIDSVAYSDDDGATYTALTSADYIPMHGEDYNSPKSYNLLRIDVTGDLNTWPRGQKSVRIIGDWGFTDDRNRMFEDTTDEVEDNPLTAAATTLTLNDVDGVDKWGITPRVSPGQILQIESEFAEVTGTDTATGTNTATIVRGINGSTAAEHAQNTQVDKFMPPEPVKQALIIQAIHQFKRGQAGFGDAEAIPDLGKIMHIKTIDPEALTYLSNYVKLGLS
jgi:hypothetical protein